MSPDERETVKSVLLRQVVTRAKPDASSDLVTPELAIALGLFLVIVTLSAWLALW